MALNEIARSIIEKNRLMHTMYMHSSLSRQKRRSKLAINDMLHLGGRVLDAKNIRFTPNKSQNELHIIGSGWSLNKSLKHTNRSSAFVVGFNYAVLADIRFDAYFIEFAGPNLKGLAKQQRELLIKYVLPLTNCVYFKHLSQPHNSVNLAFEYFSDIASFAQNLLIPCLSPIGLSACCGELLKPHEIYIKEYMSTVLSMVALGRHSGFKKIILHGVDFGGQYFYEAEDFRGIRTVMPSVDGGYYAKTKDLSKNHATNVPKIGVKAMLPLLKNKLNAEGVGLYCGSAESPSREILPVFER